MSRSRKYRIITKGRVMPAASQIAEGLHDLADAVRTLAGVAAWSAAAEHSDTHGRQNEMAAVILKFGMEGFFHAKIDGQRVSDADQEEARRMFDKIFPMKRCPRERISRVDKSASF